MPHSCLACSVTINLKLYITASLNLLMPQFLCLRDRAYFIVHIRSVFPQNTHLSKACRDWIMRANLFTNLYSQTNNLMTLWEGMETQMWLLFGGQRPLWGKEYFLVPGPSQFSCMPFVLHEVSCVTPQQAQ